MDLIKNNYMRPSGSGDTFHVSIDAPTNKQPDYLKECQQVAEYVYGNRQGKLYLMYSGGVDSEFALNVFLSLGIDITPVIIKLNPGYNDHDVKYAFDFCTSKNLKPLVIDIDFDTFVKSGQIIDLAEKYKIGVYQLPSTFNVLPKIDGTIIMGSHGPTHIAKDQKTKIWNVDEYEPFWTCLDFFKQNNLYGCPFFLAYSPEQYLAFMQDPIMTELANNQIPGKLGSNSSKWRIFNNLAPFNMIERPKFTGYENIENSPIFQHEHLKQFDQYKQSWGGTHNEPFFEMLKRMES
jgi:hypothetical protein